MLCTSEAQCPEGTGCVEIPGYGASLCYGPSSVEPDAGTDTDTETDTDSDCSAESYQQCAGGNVTWFDSCGVQGAVADTCAACEHCDNSNSTTAVCDVDVDQSYQECGADDNVHWFDSCDTQGAIYDTCGDEETCVVDECVASGSDEGGCMMSATDACGEYPGSYYDSNPMNTSCTGGGGTWLTSGCPSNANLIGHCVFNSGNQYESVFYYYSPTFNLTSAQSNCTSGSGIWNG